MGMRPRWHAWILDSGCTGLGGGGGGGGLYSEGFLDALSELTQGINEKGQGPHSPTMAHVHIP